MCVFCSAQIKKHNLRPASRHECHETSVMYGSRESRPDIRWERRPELWLAVFQVAAARLREKGEREIARSGHAEALPRVAGWL
jgi:hypothetical protein